MIWDSKCTVPEGVVPTCSSLVLQTRLVNLKQSYFKMRPSKWPELGKGNMFWTQKHPEPKNKILRIWGLGWVDSKSRESGRMYMYHAAQCGLASLYFLSWLLWQQQRHHCCHGCCHHCCCCFIATIRDCSKDKQKETTMFGETHRLHNPLPHSS